MGGNPNANQQAQQPSSAGGGQAPTWATDSGQAQPANGGGAWQDQNGSWAWVPGSTPDPNLVGDWGSETLTDPTRNPNGVANTGAWLMSAKQAVWVWGATPDPNEVAKYGQAALTNPDNNPYNGASVSGNPGAPPPPDVAPPTITDTSGGVAPDLTGNVPPSGPGADNGDPGEQNMGTTATQGIAPDGQSTPNQTNQPPPSHPAYAVSPGAIRDTEAGLLSQIDDHIETYNNLKNTVYDAVTSGNLATDPNIYESLHNTMDNLLENYADVVTAMGGLSGQLNSAAQSYTHADMSSALPQS
jgi:hypothetical protein